MIALKFSACAYTHAWPYPRNGRGSELGRGTGREERKIIAGSLSISGVYLKTVLQVAIETHK